MHGHLCDHSAYASCTAGKLKGHTLNSGPWLQDSA